MIISHLVAASQNNVIGKENKLPWSLPDDFKYFKNKTWGMPVIMGRNTFESLQKSLPGRINIVITTKPDWSKDEVVVAHTIDEAISKARDTDCKEVFIIGGGKIFEQTMQLVNRIYITRVHTQVQGDTFYPAIDEKKWTLISSDPHASDEKHAFTFTFEVWEKKV
ncbi:MAG: dihydrofolate reductase [Chitinophagaceae bacterium]|nr:dihydrofolate reductase [Chitinophagaceae bacterium]